MSSKSVNRNEMTSKEKSQFIFRMLEGIYTKPAARKTKMETIAACVHHLNSLEKKAAEIYGNSFAELKKLALFEK